jgi:hypothetical protein
MRCSCVNNRLNALKLHTRAPVHIAIRWHSIYCIRQLFTEERYTSPTE